MNEKISKRKMREKRRMTERKYNKIERHAIPNEILFQHYKFLIFTKYERLQIVFE